MVSTLVIIPKSLKFDRPTRHSYYWSEKDYFYKEEEKFILSLDKYLDCSNRLILTRYLNWLIAMNSTNEVSFREYIDSIVILDYQYSISDIIKGLNKLKPCLLISKKGVINKNDWVRLFK